jgi:uncharacterized membrane protein
MTMRGLASLQPLAQQASQLFLLMVTPIHNSTWYM